ncbi:MauE/DoxX family redox-associated membrane protein [Chryseobacterium sp.]|uniref:DoxX family protein n=1 Tax=Chryseobacterium sp. TaxID=1871047 RepID=UPI0025C264C8|nr:MauE/DoxX family redox-associated membrane protein [Chryseobacterium sp.]MBV8326698.1 tellurium resistance protein TerC [Chryseobacterium sp.]
MRKVIGYIPLVTTYFFILLFMYAAVNKILDFENFQIQIAQSPLLTAYAGVISYGVIIIELLTVILLLIPRLQHIGLLSSLGIMTGFSTYIYMILHYSESIPCSCGGILEKMDWNEHLIFNMGCVLLVIIALICIQYNQQKNKYKVYIQLATTILVGFSTVLLLYISSEHIIKKENSFTRRFLIHPLIEDKRIQLDNDHYYFAGSNNKYLFLGNPSFPLILSSVGNNFTTLKKMKIHPDHTDFYYTNLQLKVADQNYYLYDGSVPIIYKGKTNDSLAHTISYNHVYFNQLAVIDSLNFAVRIRSSQTGEYELGTLRLNGKPTFTAYDQLLEKQIDGIFDVDGQLTVDSKTRDIIYMYTYRNQFLVMNDSLQLKKKLKTIDTISKAQINPIKLSNGNTKLKSPPLKVNSGVTANGSILFNHSYLMGKYEPSERWKKSTIIDIYRTDRQEYLGSFYIDHIDNKPVSQIIVTDQYLYAIIGKNLIRYRYRGSNVKYFTTGEAENLNKE